MALKKICKCGKLINYIDKYCDECKAKNEEQIKQRHNIYKSNRKDKWEQSFYSSTKWERVKKIIKIRDKGLCSLCLSNDIITLMDTVHHIIELKEDRSKALSSDNLICLCESCHQTIHKLYINNKLDTQSKLREMINSPRGQII